MTTPPEGWERPERWERTVDVVVIGSGAAALAGALAAAEGGASVLVLEKSHLLGGTTAMSGAGTWIPANHHMLAAGIADSPADALTYIRANAPAGWAVEEEPLWRAMVEHAPEMLAFLERRTPLRFELVHHPDLYVESPGGRLTGRMVSPKAIALSEAGPWRRRIRGSTLPQLFTYRDFLEGVKLTQSVPGFLRLAPRIAWRWLARRVGMGNALVTGLVRGCLDSGCEIWAEARAVSLVTDGGVPAEGRVIGVELEKDGRRLAVRAARGVLIATGGFEWNPELRARHFPGEVGLIGSPRTNTGDGQLMAAAVGAKLARMDQANIFPSAPTRYEGERQALPFTELYFPHCILVDRSGRRFTNEGGPNVGVDLDRRDPATGLPIHLPAWRIFDARYARLNPYGMRLARREPGYLHRAGDIATLAARVGLDPAALQETVARFNGFVRAGADADFARGETAWEKFYTGDDARPNGNGALGAIATPPFYAAPYHRAILVTKGGPRTNERGQVLREDGSRIAGLYCAGVAMANPIGSKAVGAGTTIGPCLTWGYICGRTLLRENG
jgi:3-oxosteroid 1-dehydrogenase